MAPILIVLGGLPGVGKTTIARVLARDLRAVHIRIDSIEQAIRESGVTIVSLDDAGYRVGYAVAADNLRLGRTVIADSVNPLSITRDAWVAVATGVRVSAIEVEVVCSDVVEHRRRVERRSEGPAGVSQPTWQDVVARDYQPWNREHAVIDTAARTVSQTVAMILDVVSRLAR